MCICIYAFLYANMHICISICICMHALRYECNSNKICFPSFITNDNACYELQIALLQTSALLDCVWMCIFSIWLNSFPLIPFVHGCFEFVAKSSRSIWRQRKVQVSGSVARKLQRLQLKRKKLILTISVKRQALRAHLLCKEVSANDWQHLQATLKLPRAAKFYL